VPDFAGRLAARLGLTFIQCVHKTRDTAPQKSMANSYQQAKNLAGAFKVDPTQVVRRPVLLIDDMIHSGWTMTIVGALLRQAGSGPVYPLALSMVGLNQGW
jgi:ATP-dependent DNA helicase RecQ